MMKRILFLCILMIIILSCNKDDGTSPNETMTILGTWNESFRQRFNLEGELTGKESLDTIMLINISIGELIIQEMLIHPAHSFSCLLYYSYGYKNGVLQRYPDSLIDIHMNKYYWNSEDRSFGTFPNLAGPFECTIEQTENNGFTENRVFDGYGSLDIRYERLNEMNTDLKIEFENYCEYLQEAKNKK